jgi:membrane peptidoglycan carboxypeptidase
VQLLNWWAKKTSSVGRIVILSALGGALVAAMALPVIATTGILVRNASDSFTTMAISTSGLPQRSAIYDSDGKLMTYVYGVSLGKGETAYGIDRQPVTYAQISPNVVNAIVAIEDDRFWQHGGFDVKGTLRALINDLEGKAVQGGSTLEQQYVKNEIILQAVQAASSAPNETAYQADLTAAQNLATEQTINRKLDQLRQAVEVAQTMTKPEIVAGYLNDAYFGEGAWGIEAAAETYFDTTAAKLTLPEAATLAGIVENPSEYDPVADLKDPSTGQSYSLERRNTVLARIQQTNPAQTNPMQTTTPAGTPPMLTAADAKAVENQNLVLKQGGQAQNGCTANTVGAGNGFFCDDVVHTLLLDKGLGTTPEARAQLLSTGGLQIKTTLSEQDETAANSAVNHTLPAKSQAYNPSQNAATEVLIQPGTGQVKAIAEDRQYGSGKGQTEIDYAVNDQYGGGAGVQTGSSSKLFTLLTALNQGVPLGSTLTVSSPSTVTGYTDCEGNGTNPFNVVNSEGVSKNTSYSLYTGTALSINVYYATLEKQVGLCNTVKTAMDLGMTRVDGKSLLSPDGTKGTPSYQNPADDIPSFTLGTVNVSPMSMAAAYAVPASGGMYCAPIVLTKIVSDAGKSLPVPSANCHRVISSSVAQAADYVLHGVLTFPGGTATDHDLANYDAAGKTGTSNVESGNGTPYAAFAGFTTALTSYTSVFNPKSPTANPMVDNTACYQLEYGGAHCFGEMFGDNAPAEVWHMTFDHANLHGSATFPTAALYSSNLMSQGDGTVVKQPCQPAKNAKGNNANNNANNANSNNANCPTNANAAAATTGGTATPGTTGATGTAQTGGGAVAPPATTGGNGGANGSPVSTTGA